MSTECIAAALRALPHPHISRLAHRFSGGGAVGLQHLHSALTAICQAPRPSPAQAPVLSSAVCSLWTAFSSRPSYSMDLSTKLAFCTAFAAFPSHSSHQTLSALLQDLHALIARDPRIAHDALPPIVNAFAKLGDLRRIIALWDSHPEEFKSAAALGNLASALKDCSQFSSESASQLEWDSALRKCFSSYQQHLDKEELDSSNKNQVLEDLVSAALQFELLETALFMFQNISRYDLSVSDDTVLKLNSSLVKDFDTGISCIILCRRAWILYQLALASAGSESSISTKVLVSFLEIFASVGDRKGFTKVRALLNFRNASLSPRIFCHVFDGILRCSSSNEVAMAWLSHAFSDFRARKFKFDLHSSLSALETCAYIGCDAEASSLLSEISQSSFSLSSEILSVLLKLILNLSFSGQLDKEAVYKRVASLFEVYSLKDLKDVEILVQICLHNGLERFGTELLQNYDISTSENFESSRSKHGLSILFLKSFELDERHPLSMFHKAFSLHKELVSISFLSSRWSESRHFLKAACECGSDSLLHEVWDWMITLPGPASRQCFDLMAIRCCNSYQNGTMNSEQALPLLNTLLTCMETFHFVPSHVFMQKAFEICVKSKMTDAAMSLYRRCVSKNVKLSLQSYEHLVQSIYCSSLVQSIRDEKEMKLSKLCVEILEDMDRAMVTPSLEALKAMYKVCALSQDARAKEVVCERMRTCVHERVMFEFVI